MSSRRKLTILGRVHGFVNAIVAIDPQQQEVNAAGHKSYLPNKTKTEI